MTESPYKIIEVNVIYDREVNVYSGTSGDLIGLIVEAETFEELVSEIKIAVPKLLKYTFNPPELVELVIKVHENLKIKL